MSPAHLDTMSAQTLTQPLTQTLNEPLTQPGSSADLGTGLAGSSALAPIERLEEDRVYANPWVSVFFDRVALPGGAIARWNRIQVGQHDGVAVLPVRAQRIGLVAQYRYAISAVSMEIPRGFGDTDDHRSEALRELAEETGSRPGEVIALGGVHPDNGILDSLVHLFLVEVDEDAPLAPVEAHEPPTFWLPIDDVVAQVASGSITDAFTVAAVGRARLRGLI